MGEDAPLKTYRGNCHCAAFVFEITRPELKQVGECNCSICHKKGYAWFFAGADDVRVVKGDMGGLKEYAFNEGNFVHRFCPNCATPIMAYCPSMPAGRNTGINARVLQDVDVWKLETQMHDGRKLEPAYRAPVYTGPAPDGNFEGGGRTYTGSCHCGAIRLAIKTPKPLDEYEKVIECNCSICMRLADLWIYPKEENIALEGVENVAHYKLGPEVWRKVFCKYCGVHIMSDINPVSAEQVKELPEEVQKWREEYKDVRPLNIRVLNDFDSNTVKTQRIDGWNLYPPLYVNP